MSLRLLSVTRRYGGERALDGVSLHVRPGDCYGLIGHNGAGKTTAMRIALGLQRADAGTVEVDGLDPARAPREAHGRIGGLIETPGFHGHLDARANLVLLARLGGRTRAEARAEADEQLERVGLASVGRKRVHGFSQGMRQRLGIAQALLGSPRYVLLDEPTNGLDPEGSAEVRALLGRLVREEGLTVLVSSHQLHELAELCNRIGILQRGRLLVEAETRELLAAVPGRFEVETDDDTRAARVLAELGVESVAAAHGGLVLTTGAHGAGEIARALVDAGLDLQRLGAREATLEEIYLRWARGEVRTLEGLGAGGTQAEARAHGAAGTMTGGQPARERRGAGSGLARVARYELARFASRWSNAGLLALPAGLAAVEIALAKGRAANDAAQVASGELASATATTGFVASAEALATGLPLLALVLAALASQMIAGELARGTLRNVLLRPQTRLDVAGGKALAGALLALAAHGLLVGTAVATAALAFGFGDLVEILPNGKPFPLVAASELSGDFARALSVPAAALLGYLLLGFLCGAFARSAAGALGLALGAVLGVDLVRTVARDLGLEGGLLSAYLPTPLGDTSFLHAFADRARGVSNSVFELGRSFLGVPQDVLVPLAWAAASFVLAAVLLSRRSVP